MAAPAEPTTHWSKKPLTLRLASAAVLIPIVVAAVFAGGIAWTLLVLLFSAVMIVEWCKIASRKPGAIPWYVLGLPYVFVPCAALIWLRADLVVGLQQIFWIVALVIFADTGAYIAGRSIGGPKLAPRVSPNKTWSGAAGGTLGAVAIALMLAKAAGLSGLFAIAMLAVVLSVCAQAGDVFESFLKRSFGVKDSGHLIPGHGGLMDRLDGFLTASVAAALIGLARGGFEAPGRGLLVW